MISLIDLTENLKKLKNWAVEGSSIVKEKWFQNEAELYNFLVKMKEKCEKENHYPNIIVSKNILKIILTTKEKGITEVDFKVAQEIDSIKN